MARRAPFPWEKADVRTPTKAERRRKFCQQLRSAEKALRDRDPETRSDAAVELVQLSRNVEFADVVCKRRRT